MLIQLNPYSKECPTYILSENGIRPRQSVLGEAIYKQMHKNFVGYNYKLQSFTFNLYKIQHRAEVKQHRKAKT